MTDPRPQFFFQGDRRVPPAVYFRGLLINVLRVGGLEIDACYLAR